MSKKIPIPVFRTVINALSLEATIYDLNLAKTKFQLDPNTELFLLNLQKIAFNARVGIAKPTYEQNGRSQATAISLESLGGMETPDNDRRENNPVPDNITFERRVPIIQEEVIHCTDEERLDAEFAAADHKILTGEDKHWKFFLPIRKGDIDINQL